jgi:HlyD family secretion protein
MRLFLHSKRFFALLAAVALLAAGGLWYYYAQVIPAQASSTAETMQTARVRRGNLVIVASGTGTLIPSTEVNLGFRAGGVLAEVPVDVGDRVEAGDLLVRLDTAALERVVTQAEIALRRRCPAGAGCR